VPATPLTPVRPHGAVAGGRDIDLPGVDIRLRGTRWPGAGTAVLLLHGLASQRRFWNLVVPHLAGVPVLAIDQRGHGESQQPETGYDTSTVAQDALTALDAVGLSRVVVVGHSWGAQVALTLAAEHPERALAVVAVDGGLATPSAVWSREEARTALAPPRLAVEPDELPAMLRRGPLGPWWSDEVETAVLPIFGVGPDGLARARLSFERHMDIVETMYDYRPDDVLSRVGVPCWLAVAENSQTASAWAADRDARLDRITELVAQPRVVRIEGALHDVPLQWPALVAGLVRAAVDEVGVLAGNRGSG
jgi:pimeloyl-ACP methyl ester carboxylesterase